jgi:Fe2+ or Zn2+ uptake regulation protein
MRESGSVAEQHASRNVLLEHAEKSVSKLSEFFAKDSEELADSEKKILELIKQSPNKKIGELYKQLQESGSNISYKSFQRKIEKLEKGKFISADKTGGGKQGNTKIINIKDKQLTDY